MNIDRDLIYLGALIHDIGKFAQRADNKSWRHSDYIPERIKNMASSICPKDKDNNRITHIHALYSAAFIENHQKVFQRCLNYGTNEIKDLDTFIKLAASHHDPYSKYEKIIQKADILSSGSERTDKEAVDKSTGENKWDAFKTTRMVSVFESIHKGKKSYSYQLPVNSISFDKNEFFPKKEYDQNPDYTSLWSEFVNDFNRINTNHPRILAETLLHILHKYTVNIPSSTIDLPDVSLYDHLKTTAAFAVTLFDYLSEKNETSVGKDEKIVMLIGGDISGIQNFIYDIVSKYAAKNLKGRSFYLQLLVESVINRILNELNLPQSNVIYSSGGKFYILGPNLEHIRKKLEELEEEIDTKIFATHKESLYLAIDYVTNTEKEIKNKLIGQTWQELNQSLNRKKRKRYHRKLIDNYEDFFEPFGKGALQKRDAITGEEISKDEESNTIDGDNSLHVKTSTYEQIQLGKDLKKAVYWLITREPIHELRGYNPSDLGVYHYLLKGNDLSHINFKNLEEYHSNQVLLINELDFDKKIPDLKNAVWGFTLYGGNNYPVFNEDYQEKDGTVHKAGDSKSYEFFGGEGSFRRIGMLRMDIDNLGQIFIKGFNDEKRTYSRYSALSRNLDYFFKGYLNSLWTKEDYRECSSLVYAGGDDLFIVGKWDNMIRMAEEIKNDFKEWTCNNPELSLSGGIAVVPVKFPVMKGAGEAGVAENAAKDHKVRPVNQNPIEKNAFTLMNHPLNWDIEYRIVKNYKERIKNNVNKQGGLPNGFFERVSSYFENARIKNHRITNLQVLWLMAYDFGRMAKNLKDKDAKQLLKDCQKGVYTNSIDGEKNATSYHFLELLNISARWAELE
ncbi:MAG: type III-A CRISPR-associated protein Cas10/Csm1, partial [Bacteroidota bacterium]